MGCDYYGIRTWNSKTQAQGERYVHFSESDDGVCCLCTFPYDGNQQLSAETVRSLALLGAAVVLAFQSGDDDTDDTLHIPQDVPPWIVQEIARLLPKEQK